MRLRFITGGLALTLGIGLLAGGAWSQDKPAEPPGGPGGMPDMADAMKKWKAAATPGNSHKLLDQLTGEWTTKMKMWMGGPGTPPMETEGRSTVKWALDGRFIEEELENAMMMPDDKGAMKPMKYKGRGLTGYDNFRKAYVASWADNMNTHLLSLRGSADGGGKTITFYGEMDEPMMDLYGRMVKYVSRIVDKDKHVFEIYDLHAGENYKVLELTYTRAK